MTEAGPSGKLTPAEHKRFDDLLGEIDAGIDSWRRIGERLKELRDNRLYRNTHSTFPEFCRDRWNWSKAYTHRFIVSSNYATSFENKITDISRKGNSELPFLPQFTTETSVLPLRKVPAGQQDEVAKVIYDNAPEDGRITAKLVKEAVAQVCKPEKKKTPERIKCPHCKGRGWTSPGT